MLTWWLSIFTCGFVDRTANEARSRATVARVRKVGVKNRSHLRMTEMHPFLVHSGGSVAPEVFQSR